MSPHPHFTRVPRAVTDALQSGVITPLQCLILMMLHKNADWKTGEVKSWSADRFLFEMGDQESLPLPRTVRRAMQALRDAGWCSHDYVAGPKRPYNVLLNNFAIQADAQANDQGQTVLRPCQITTSHEASLGHDQASVQANDQGALGQMATKYQIGSRSNAAQAEENSEPGGSPRSSSRSAPTLGSPQKQEKTAPQDLFREAQDILGWLPTTAPSALKRLRAAFSYEEIVAMLRVYRSVCDTPRDIKKLFADGGALIEIDLREDRRKRAVVSGTVKVTV